MAEPQKQQMGDGSDNIGQAAGQAAKAAKNAGKQAAKQAAKKGAEAAANAAAATVKAGVEGGKAVAEIAAGTAAGGPWGAVISAAWAMRHTLFKILVCLCLSVVFLIVMIVELPGIIINKALVSMAMSRRYPSRRYMKISLRRFRILSRPGTTLQWLRWNA